MPEPKHSSSRKSQHGIEIGAQQRPATPRRHQQQQQQQQSLITLCKQHDPQPSHNMLLNGPCRRFLL
jgi:hypothetical protein